MNNVKGSIKLNNSTKSHEASLKRLGYSVAPGEGCIVVEGSAFVAHLDLSTSDQLKEVIANRQLLTYGTKITFPDGKVLSSVPACLKLGSFSKTVGLPNLSCLVVKPGTGEGGSKSAATVRPSGEWAGIFGND